MLEVEMPETELAELIEWLKQESERSFALHLWDWEVKLLLAALRTEPPHDPKCQSLQEVHKLGMTHYETDWDEPCPPYHFERGKCNCRKPLKTSYRFGSVGDARRPGHDAPLPGEGWVPEKDR